MAIVAETSATGTQGWGTTLTINKPTGTVDGDVMVAFMQDVPAATTAPAGWTLVGTANGAYLYQRLYYKVAASEGASYAWSWSGDGYAAGGIVRYSGVDTTTVEDVAESTNTGASAAPRGLSITTATDGAMVILCVGWNNNGYTHTAPTGMTEVWESTRVAFSDVIQATAGATGNKDATLSTSNDWGTIMWALRPASGGGATNLVVANLTSAQTTARPVIGPHLKAYNVTSAHTMSRPVIGPRLVPANLTSAMAITTLRLIVGLQVQNILSAQALTQASPLVVRLIPANITSAQTVGNVTLSQIITLIVANITSGQSLTAISLTAVYNLIVANIASGQALTQASLTAVYNLLVANLTSAQTTSNVIVTVSAGDVINLIVANITSGQTLSTMPLTQIYNLVVHNIRTGNVLSALILAVVGAVTTISTHRPGHARERDQYDKVLNRHSEYDDQRQRGRSLYDKLRGSRK
jgi:hypothetical protein